LKRTLIVLRPLLLAAALSATASLTDVTAAASLPALALCHAQHD